MSEQKTVVADDGSPLAVCRWSANEGRAIVLLLHDLRQDSSQYAAWAESLAASGIDIFALDLRGHGQTTPAVDSGLVEPRPVWQTLANDVARLRRYAIAEAGRRPVFLLGVGVSARLLQYVAQSQGQQYAGLVLVNPGHIAAPQRVLLQLLARVECWRRGHTSLAGWLDNWFVQRFQRQRATGRSDKHGLTASSEEQAPGGPALRLQTLSGVVAGLAKTSRRSQRLRMSAGLPILLLAGGATSDDDNTRTTRQLITRLINDGCTDVSRRFYIGASPKIAADATRADFLHDLTEWINERAISERSHAGTRRRD